MIERKTGKHENSMKIKGFRNRKRYIWLILSILIICILTSTYGVTLSPGDNIDSIGTVIGLKFITVGDPQINSTTLDGVERLRRVVSFANKSDVDFVVFEGDMTDDGTNKSNDMVKSILGVLEKPYWVVVGNHDLFESPKIFESYYGPMEHIENINGYQLLFVGMTDKKNEKGDVIGLNWSFDFDKADKNVPTLVFVHGPVRSIPTGCIYCRMQKDILAYGYSMRSDLGEFADLIGVYSGHIHYDSDRVVNGTRYITINGLIDINVDGITIAHASNKVGYSVIKDDESHYELLSYV